jgi:hypothetical protein
MASILTHSDRTAVRLCTKALERLREDTHTPDEGRSAFM